MAIQTSYQQWTSQAFGNNLEAEINDAQFIEQMVRELFERTHSLERENRYLQSALATERLMHQREVSVLSVELEDARAQVADLSQELATYEQDVETYVQDVRDEQEAEIANHAAAMSVELERIASLRLEVAALKTTIASLNGGNASLQLEVAALKRTIASLNDGIERRNVEIESQKSRYAALVVEWKEHKKMREQFLDIIGGLRNQPGYKISAAKAKCKIYGL